ncbi:hypothetical protein [Thermofilum pendens]|uniref:hypothetical protein n=1 Tax=Thermofilum pendens TaxID=2269 RepID=UPI0011E51AC9|nr:hypothetical protein [Thermofilum pendens]
MGYMGEKTKPSKLLIVVTMIPVLLDGAVWMVTEGFNVKPRFFPPLVYAVGSLVMLVLAVFVSFIGYTMSKDEEPEWGSKLPFKLIQALNILWVLVSVMFALLVVFIYFMRIA